MQNNIDGKEIEIDFCELYNRGFRIVAEEGLNRIDVTEKIKEKLLKEGVIKEDKCEK